ncbi:MAG TPA: hypothetical protein VKR58_06260 [Aquella sp.]|nr:hypothetical protein [Aquella sp.]
MSVALKAIPRNPNSLEALRLSQQNCAKPFLLVDPEGCIHQGINLNKFAEEHNLIRTNLRKVMVGERKSCCGWTRYIPEPEENIFILYTSEIT